MTEQPGHLPDIEALLRRALQPVEPPADLGARLESRLSTITDMAAEELEGWELSAMRDPREWPTIPRAAAAAAIGTAAGAGLVVLRVRAGHRKRRRNAGDPLELVEDTLRAAVDETRKLLDR
ncbi:MAG TPA: hypothetical protein VD931_21000 [Baekduia sp.]|nr:hypothetical protein [Baekduia sp.]